MILLLLCIWTSNFGDSTSEDFYKALYSSSLTTIDVVLGKLEKETTTTATKAYKGALLMKKSEFMKTVSQKIDMFKVGHELLEAAIKKAPQNAEYRFIRLTIQENAPKLLKYNKNIAEDKGLVVAEFKKMGAELRACVLDYAGQSRILKKEELE